MRATSDRAATVGPAFALAGLATALAPAIPLSLDLAVFLPFVYALALTAVAASDRWPTQGTALAVAGAGVGVACAPAVVLAVRGSLPADRVVWPLLGAGAACYVAGVALAARQQYSPLVARAALPLAPAAVVDAVVFASGVDAPVSAFGVAWIAFGAAAYAAGVRRRARARSP